MSHDFVLLGTPHSKKNNWAPNGRGGIYQKDKTLKPYVEGLQLQALFQAKKNGFEKIPAPYRVAVRYKVFFGKRQHAMDVHNAFETLLDALQGVCYDNDNQVVGQFHPPIRFIDEANPRIELEIARAQDAEHEERWR